MNDPIFQDPPMNYRAVLDDGEVTAEVFAEYRTFDDGKNAALIVDTSGVLAILDAWAAHIPSRRKWTFGEVERDGGQVIIAEWGSFGGQQQLQLSYWEAHTEAPDYDDVDAWDLMECPLVLRVEHLIPEVETPAVEGAD